MDTTVDARLKWLQRLGERQWLRRFGETYVGRSPEGIKWG